MPYRILNRDEHFRNDGRPKRILALDGGGLRGVLSLGILEKVEDLLRERHRLRRRLPSLPLLRLDRRHLDWGDHRSGSCPRLERRRSQGQVFQPRAAGV